MANTVNSFEKKLVATLNFIHGKNYKNNALMEWSIDEKTVRDNLRDGESFYEIPVIKLYVAMKN